MHILNSMRINAKTKDVLEALIGNRTKHREIVIEAREGYAKRAVEVLKAELKRLETSKNALVMFSLQPPQDHTKVYDTAIEMMRMHQDETVVLDSGQVRNLMMDEWDWKTNFLVANSMYSGKAVAATRGMSQDDD